MSENHKEIANATVNLLSRLLVVLKYSSSVFKKLVGLTLYHFRTTIFNEIN